MKEEYYEAGNDDACTDMGLEKEAFWGALRSGASKLVSSIPGKHLAAQAGGKIGPKAIKNKLAPYGTKAEQGVAKGVGKAFGPTAEKATSGLLKGTAGEMGKQMAGGAAILGGIQGTAGALAAPEGQGTEQFFKGLGQGALMGAGYGAAGGLAAGSIKNLRRKSLQQMAKRQNPALDSRSATNLANEQLNRGFFGSAKDLATGKGLMGRSGSGANLAGGPTQLAGEFMAGEALMAPFGMSIFSDHSPESAGAYPGATQSRMPSRASYVPTQNFKVSSDLNSPNDPAIPPPLVGSVAGGGAGGLTTRMLVGAARKKGKIPPGVIGSAAEHVAPFLGSAGGALSGYYAGSKMQPEPEVNWEEKLNKIDFDKLMRYYKKREADQG